MSTTSQTLGTSTSQYMWILWSSLILGLIGLLYAHVLKGLVVNWWTDPDYSHGFFVLPFSTYIAWRQRHCWTELQSMPSNWGLAVMILAVSFLLLGSLAAELFTTRISMLLFISGMVVFIGGWDALRAIRFPLGFLMFMIPLPVIIYNQITFPLQLLTSRLASSCLELVQIPVLRDGNVLAMSNYSLEVVEACSGIRSLLTLGSLAVAYGYLAEKQFWTRSALVVLVVPIAIITNAIRVFGAGVLARQLGPSAAEGFLHEFSGWIIFLCALALIFGAHRILRLLAREPEKSIHA